jgi:hypothetical protein
MARQGHAAHALVVPEHAERLEEQGVAQPVICRAARRAAQHHERTVGLPLERERREHGRVRLEVRQVELLLEPPIEDRLRRNGALPIHSRIPQRLGQQHEIGQPEGQVVGGLVLVVHRRDAGHADDRRRQQLPVGVVGQGQLGPVAAGPADEAGHAPGHHARLADPGPGAGATDHLDVGPALARQLDRLGVVARRDRDGVTGLFEPARERREEQRVR